MLSPAHELAYFFLFLERMVARILMAILGSAMLLFHSNDAACDTTYSLRKFQIISPGTLSVFQQNTASPPLALSYSARRLFNMLPESEFLPHLRLRLRGGRVSLFLSLNNLFFGAPRFVLMFCLRITVPAVYLCFSCLVDDLDINSKLIVYLCMHAVCLPTFYFLHFHSTADPPSTSG